MHREIVIPTIITSLILSRLGAELWLERLNRYYVQAHADEIPAPFAGTIDQETYRRSVAYTLAKNRLASIQAIYDTAVLLIVLFSGILPWLFQRRVFASQPLWGTAACLFLVGVGLSNRLALRLVFAIPTRT